MNVAVGSSDATRLLIVGCALVAAAVATLVATVAAVDPWLVVAAGVSVPAAVWILASSLGGRTVGILLLVFVTISVDEFLPDFEPVRHVRVSAGKTVLLVGLVCLLMRAAALREAFLRANPLTLPACAVCALAFAHIPFSPMPEVTLRKAISLALLVLMAHVVANLLERSDPRQARLAVATVVTGLGVVALAMYPTGQLLDGSPAPDGRACGTLSNPNEWAAWCLAALPTALVPERTGRRARWTTALRIAAVGLLLVSIVLSFSRGAYMAIVLTSVLAVTTMRRRGVALVCVALAVAILASTFDLVEPVVERVVSVFDSSGSDTSIRNRANILRGGLDLFLAHPLFGCGFGTFSSEVSRVSHVPYGSDAHNTFLTLAAETGLVGITVAGVFIVRLLRSLFTRGFGAAGDGGARGVFLGLVAFGLIAATATLHLESYTWFWIGWGMALASPPRESTV